MRPPSVSRRLIVSVAVPMVLFFGATILILDRLYRDVVAQSLNQRLDEQLVALITAVDVGADRQIGVRLLDPESRWSTPVSGYYAEVSGLGGTSLWRSPSLSGASLDLSWPAQASIAQRYYATSQAAGNVAVLSRMLRWEFVRGDSRELVFSVAETTGPANTRMARFRRQLIGWFSGATLTLLAVIGWLMRQALAPVRRLEAEINAIEAGEREQLSAHYPRELDGVARGLNALLVSERDRIRRYRETLGNLAHGLKTPLAVMRAAMTAEANPRRALDAQIDRIATIVDHQLKRAATGGGATLGQAAAPVAPLVVKLCEAMRKVHADKALRFDVNVPPGAAFLGDAEDLTEALGNLLDNACKYGQGRVSVSVSVDAARVPAQQLLIAVGDDGPGIAVSDRERVFDRGVRNDEREPGHGLGLGLVRDLAKLYGGALQLGRSEPLGGARFELLLPGRWLSPP